MRVISHRGRIDAERNGVPGNTLDAFDQLFRLWPDAEVETDVRLTHGGLLVVAHDGLLQTFSTGTGFVNEIKNVHELSSIHLRRDGNITNYRIPILSDVLTVLAGRGTLHLELKAGPGDPTGLLSAVVELLRRYPEQKVHLSSFDHRLLQPVPSHIPIGILTNAMPVQRLGEYVQYFTCGRKRSLSDIAFHPDIWNLTSDVLEEALRFGMAVNAYTVPPSMFQWCFDNGVNVITDEPIAAREWLAQQTQS